jgi:hypothetical protein
MDFGGKYLKNLSNLIYNTVESDIKERKMPDLISLEDEFFTEESYKEYLENEKERHNDKYRDDNETIFDALASADADFTKTPDGQKIITAIRNYK